MAGWTKKLTGKPVISVGSVGTNAELTKGLQQGQTKQNDPTAHLDELTYKLDSGEFDLIAIGRALISNPDWVTKIQEGRIEELSTFTKEDLKTLV